jgi:hypothetical protein
MGGKLAVTREAVQTGWCAFDCGAIASRFPLQDDKCFYWCEK